MKQSVASVFIFLSDWEEGFFVDCLQEMKAVVFYNLGEESKLV